MKLKLNEDIFDEVPDVIVTDVDGGLSVEDNSDKAPSGPPVGFETTIANELIDNVNGEWDTIHKYNNMISDLKQAGLDDFIPVINDINNEEHKHIGQLQELLKQLSPNTESIQSGEEEAVGQLNESYIQEKTLPDQARDIQYYIEDFLRSLAKQYPEKLKRVKKAAYDLIITLDNLANEIKREKINTKNIEVSSDED